MATFYLDFEGGNDANDGTTFANRWKTLTSGATAARTAPGDTIRIMGSPAPTSLGQTAVWTSQALPLAKNVTNATNATPISISCTAHGFSTGDLVVISNVGGNTNANGTWEITNTGANTFTLDGSSGNAAYTSGGNARLRNNTRVVLSTAVTQNIACTGPGRVTWTAVGGGNVTTAALLSTFKEHGSADQINIAAGFTTGKAAYYTLPSTLDLSGYQQVSFWIRVNSLSISASQVSLRLCSDSIGDVTVNTVSIPSVPLGGSPVWQAVTVDLGTNLGSSINSIALYMDVDLGAITINLSNIIACKASSAADSLTLNSLIGKNTSGETFWAIQSINGRRVMLDADTNALPSSATVRGYYGTSETVTTWKRETIKLDPVGTSTNSLQVIQESGTEGNPITYSGGWDRTNMSTQNLETWLGGLNGFGYAIDMGSNRSWVSLSKLAGTRFYAFIRYSTSTSYGNTLDIIAANNCTTEGILHLGTGDTVLVDSIYANAGNGFRNSGSLGPNNVTINRSFSNNSGCAPSLPRGGKLKIDARNNGAFGIDFSTGSTVGTEGIIYDSVFKDNLSGSISNTGGSPASSYSINSLFDDATEYSSGAPRQASLFSQKHDQVADNHKIFASIGLISSATDQRNTASGISWKLQPTSTVCSSVYPLFLSLAKIAVAANSLVTVKAWMRRDNSGLTLRLTCKGGQIAGVTSDVTSSVTATNTWEEETITFTPTEAGVVEIIAEAWGGTTFSGWVDDMTISQA